MSETKKKLVVVVGPTAVGKTAMAIKLANHFGTVILSADSRQFYREMSIGTAKPTAEELAAAPHYFINSHSIAEDYSAGDFEREALALLDDLFKTHDTVVLVGGSGLFVRAVCEGFDALPTALPAIREKLNTAFETEGLAPLQARLKAVDPAYFETADVQNPQRVIRALEVYETSGQPFSSFRQRDLLKRPFQVVTVGLTMERAVLYDRINRRVDAMLADGLLDEVKALLPFREKPALLTVGYAEIFDYLDGKLTLEVAVDKVKQNSRRYAKRQLTWFKKYGHTSWFTSADWDAILDYINA